MTLDHDTIATALVTAGRQAHQRDGRVIVPLPDPRHQLWIFTDRHAAMLTIQQRSSHQIARDIWPRTLGLIDDWNRRERLAKAFLATDDWDHATGAGLVVEITTPITTATLPDDAVELADLTVAAGIRCWQQLTVTQG